MGIRKRGPVKGIVFIGGSMDGKCNPNIDDNAKTIIVPVAHKICFKYENEEYERTNMSGTEGRKYRLNISVDESNCEDCKKIKNNHEVWTKDGYCSDHDFYFSLDDNMGCPVCYGYTLGWQDGWADAYDSEEGIL